MPTPEKEKLVQELSEKLSKYEVVILADYTGVNVQAVTGLRSEFRKDAIEYRIYKNRLARIAVKNSGLEGGAGGRHVVYTCRGCVFNWGDSISDKNEQATAEGLSSGRSGACWC